MREIIFELNGAYVALQPRVPWPVPRVGDTVGVRGENGPALLGRVTSVFYQYGIDSRGPKVFVYLEKLEIEKEGQSHDNDKTDG